MLYFNCKSILAFHNFGLNILIGIFKIEKVPHFRLINGLEGVFEWITGGRNNFFKIVVGTSDTSI